MGMTITEKILAAHSGNKQVRPDDLIMAKVDFVMGNDVTAPLAISQLKKYGLGGVFDLSRVALVPSHFSPPKDIKAANNVRALREFAKEKGIVNFFELGAAGIEHALLPEQGLVLPGDLVIGADSHTCTYGALGAFSTGVGSTDLAYAIAMGEVWLKVPPSLKFCYEGKRQPYVYGKDLILYTIGHVGVDGALYCAMEFVGGVIESMSIQERLTMCNMAIEAGGKSGIISPDATTEAFVKPRAKRPYSFYASDEDAEYERIYEFCVDGIEPQVALPNLPSNACPISEVGEVKIDQAFLGSCTNGCLEDLEIGAKVIKGKRVHSDVRLIVIPATPTIYKDAMEKGILKTFLEAGAVVSTPTCGPCLGGYMGVLGDGEKAVSSSNRNFVGRMGSPKSEVYLANPAVVAASAVAGKIVHPDDVQ